MTDDLTGMTAGPTADLGVSRTGWASVSAGGLALLGWAPLTLAQEGGSEVLGAPSGGAPAGGGSETVGDPAATPGSPPPGQPQRQGGAFDLLLPMVFLFVIFMIVTQMLGGRKEKKKREALLSSLKKRDRVQTYGGIIGTVVELKSDELVLKVDEGSNTRIRFSRAAVQQVLKSARGPGESDVEEVELENERYDDEAEIRA